MIVAARTTIAIQYVDNSTNENGFQLERSPDGVAFARVTTLKATRGRGYQPAVVRQAIATAEPWVVDELDSLVRASKLAASSDALDAQAAPIDGLEETVWKKNCSNCHKWERQSLCEQGASYAKNPRFALRHPHPYGGGFKAALMQWAKAGCQ